MGSATCRGKAANSASNKAFEQLYSKYCLKDTIAGSCYACVCQNLTAGATPNMLRLRILPNALLLSLLYIALIAKAIPYNHVKKDKKC